MKEVHYLVSKVYYSSYNGNPYTVDTFTMLLARNFEACVFSNKFNIVLLGLTNTSAGANQMSLIG